MAFLSNTFFFLKNWRARIRNGHPDLTKLVNQQTGLKTQSLSQTMKGYIWKGNSLRPPNFEQSCLLAICILLFFGSQEPLYKWKLLNIHQNQTNHPRLLIKIHLAMKKNPLTFPYTGCLRGIFISWLMQ